MTSAQVELMKTARDEINKVFTPTEKKTKASNDKGQGKKRKALPKKLQLPKVKKLQPHVKKARVKKDTKPMRWVKQRVLTSWRAVKCTMRSWIFPRMQYCPTKKCWRRFMIHRSRQRRQHHHRRQHRRHHRRHHNHQQRHPSSLSPRRESVSCPSWCSCCVRPCWIHCEERAWNTRARSVPRVKECSAHIHPARCLSWKCGKRHVPRFWSGWTF